MTTMKNLLTGLARQFVVGLIVLGGLTLVVGVAYPAAVWAVSRINSDGAEGSQIKDATGCVVGSELLGVDQHAAPGQPDKYLHARFAGGVDDPTAAGDPASSGASNLGPNNTDLVAIIDKRRAAVAEREGVRPDQVPADAVTRSGSSLDPGISPAYADLQAPRIARTTGLPIERVRQIIGDNTDGRQLGFLGEPTVNVARVNVALGLTGPGCR